MIYLRSEYFDYNCIRTRYCDITIAKVDIYSLNITFSFPHFRCFSFFCKSMILLLVTTPSLHEHINNISISFVHYLIANALTFMIVH